MKNKVLCIGTLVLIAFLIILPHKVQGYEYLPNLNSMKVAEEMDIPLSVRKPALAMFITISQQIGLYLVIILAGYNAYKRVSLSNKIKRMEAEETKEENAENKLNTYKEEYRIHKQRTRIIIIFAVLVIIYVFVTQIPRHF